MLLQQLEKRAAFFKMICFIYTMMLGFLTPHSYEKLLKYNFLCFFPITQKLKYDFCMMLIIITFLKLKSKFSETTHMKYENKKMINCNKYLESMQYKHKMHNKMLIKQHKNLK